jgi:excisionase family DNA binding protein
MAALAYPIIPVESEEEQIKALYKMLLHPDHPQLVDQNGTPHAIPESVHKVLLNVLARMQEGQTIALVPIMEELTTKAAADFLGVSRQYLVRLLEEGEIPFHRTGTHRRIYFKDIFDYRRKRDNERRNGIKKLARKELREGTYDDFVVPDEE